MLQGMNAPTHLIASFTGAGQLSPAPLLELLEALERRGVRYHKAVPAAVEVARERFLEDRADPVGGGSWTRRIRLDWQPFHQEPQLAQDGLEGFRGCVEDLPGALRGLRIRLGYAFPGQEAAPVQLTCLYLDGPRWEVQLAFPAAPCLDPTHPKKGRAMALLAADVAEAVYDVLAPPYGALRFDAGVLQDQLPDSGWLFLCPALVERAGRGMVEAFSKRCAKSWELGDTGWFLAPTFLEEVDEVLEEERRRLLAFARHLTLEGMRGAGWQAH